MLKNNFKRLTALYRLIGPKVATLFIAAIPVGVSLGVVEIVTATVLYAVLVDFHLVSGSPISSNLTLGLSPVTALLIFTCLAAFLRFTGQMLPAFANQQLNARLREALVRNVLGGFTERSVMSVAGSSHLLSHLIPKSGDFVHSMATIAVGLCLMLLILAGLFHISWQLTVIALAITVVLGLSLLLLRRVAGKHIERMYGLFRQFNVTFLKDIRNSHLLRLSGANEIEADRLIGISRNHIRTFKRYFVLHAFGTNLPNLAGTFLIVGIFWLNARLEFLPVAGLVPLVYLLYRTSASISSLGASAGQLGESRPYIAELVTHLPQLFPGDRAILPGDDMPPRLFPLVAENLRFGRDVALAAPLDLSAGSGDTLLIHGPSGKGKTTLLLTLIALLKPLGGAISWGGMSIEKIDPMRLRRRLGYAGPEPYLIDADIRTNLLFGFESNHVSDAEIKKALHLARAEFVFDLDGGLSHRLQEAGEGISAGHKQRLALARCILRRPDVLLLDEATANIDEDTERQIMEQLRATFPDLLIIAVSHRASMRRYATILLEI